jgi:CheY-like chemotaxis protein
MSKKVLLAEDDMTMVSLLKTLLKMEGYLVIALDADADIPAAVQHEKPDVVLLDVHLAGQSGLEIMDAIRRSSDTSDVRVVMTSGLNLREECLNHGANSFLLKPYMPDDLIETLHRAINPS